MTDNAPGWSVTDKAAAILKSYGVDDLAAARAVVALVLDEAAEVADEKENYWNTVAYDRRQGGLDDNFACASASASWKLAAAIRALKPKGDA